MKPRSHVPRIQWPDGKTFAFTVFDDPDFQTREIAGSVYQFLSDQGFRTTKGVWPGWRDTPAKDRWGTCQDAAYLKWARELQEMGFEIGWHGASPRTSTREQTQAGLEAFREMFGHYPDTLSQHYDCKENMYWGDERLLSPAHRLFYNLLTRWNNHDHFHGHIRGHEQYWADLCAEHIRYVRNFVFDDINTLANCPFMPYHDPARPEIALWYSSTEGHNITTFNRALTEEQQDRLEAEGGLCIMYTHFAYGFTENGVMNQRFQELMQRLGRKNGWFAPVRTILDYMVQQRGATTITPAQRKQLERRWLFHKVRYGSA